MAKVLNFFQTIRNNWKKSVVGAAALSYGISYSKESYDTETLMREYCENVQKYGDAALPTNVRPRHVTVILNPAAKKRKAKKLFEKYCEPLLHLAGFTVTIIQTESGNHARNVIIDSDIATNAIIVAGGDGTLSDVLTGLMRKYKNNRNSLSHCPIGILPLGEKNNIANSLYKKYDNLQEVKQIIEATMAVINDNYKFMDVIEIEPLQQDLDDPIKPIYAMGNIEWGAWKDAHALMNKYWYWGPLKKYATYVFNGFKDKLNWECNAIIKYTDPCSGCSQCYQKDLNFTNSANLNRRWWHAFIPQYKAVQIDNNVDYSKKINEKCSIVNEIPISTTELNIQTSNVNQISNSSISSLKINLGPKNIDYFSYVMEGWKQENEIYIEKNQVVEAKSIELIPEIPENVESNKIFFIDNEEYELKPIKIKLFPKTVKIFSSESGIEL